MMVSMGAWAIESPWSVEEFSGSISDGSTTINNVTWTMTNSSVGSSANGAPAWSVTSNKWKFGSSKNQFWNSYTLSSDAFANFSVTEVEIGCYDNGGADSRVTVAQGDITIGTTAVSTTTTSNTVKLNSKPGKGGALTIKYESDKQASYITKLVVTFTSLSGEKVYHQITWSVNGNTTEIEASQVEEGYDITFPTGLADINGKKFMGWSANENASSASDLVSGKIESTADATYYAVFATQAGTGKDVLDKITDVNQVEEGVYALLSFDESYYLPNAKSNAAPSVTGVTKDGDDITVSENMKWTLSIDDDGNYILMSNASTADEELYLWGAPTNEGVRIVTASQKTNPFKTWQLMSTNDYGLVLYHQTSSTANRYLSTYGTQDWRNYESTSKTNRAANLYKFVPGYTYSDYTTTVAAPAPTYVSLDELIDAELEEETVVNVTIEDVVYGGMGVNGNYMVMLQNSGAYLVAPGSDLGWAMGGSVSGTLENVTWDPYNYTLSSETGFWSSLEYTAPAGGATETITINPACTDGDFYYTTYSSANAFYAPNDLIIYEVMVDGGEIALEPYEPGNLVPAYTGVLVCAMEGGDYEVDIETDYEMLDLAESVLGDDNALRPTCFEGGLTADDMAAEAPGMKYYRLTMHNGTQCGFWWGAAEGAAFNIAENKAYLVAGPAVNKAKGFSFKDITTGIEKAMAEKANNKVRYNLNGQRVNANAKGIIIVNGKKVIKK